MLLLCIRITIDILPHASDFSGLQSPRQPKSKIQKYMNRFSGSVVTTLDTDPAIYTNRSQFEDPWSQRFTKIRGSINRWARVFRPAVTMLDGNMGIRKSDKTSSDKKRQEQDKFHFVCKFVRVQKITTKAQSCYIMYIQYYIRHHDTRPPTAATQTTKNGYINSPPAVLRS